MNFVVIAAPRTGSTHFTSLLHTHDNIICHGEIFNPTRIFVRLPKNIRSPDMLATLAELRQRDPYEFLRFIFAQNHGCAHVGFKIFVGHNDDVLETIIRDPSIGKIILLRQNVLASYSSSAIKKRFGKNPANLPGSPQPTVEFNTKKFLAYREHVARFYRAVFEKLARARQFSFVVHYEQINDPWLFANLLTFIGAEPTAPKMRAGRHRQNSSEMLSRFSNPDDVTKCLRRYGLMGWLHESAVSLDALPTCTTGESEDGNGGVQAT